MSRLTDAVTELCAAYPTAVPLDVFGDTMGAIAASAAEVDEAMHALEKRGRTVVAPEHPAGEEILRVVLMAARTLKGDLGRVATRAELAGHTGLSDSDVSHALELSKVLARSR